MEKFWEPHCYPNHLHDLLAFTKAHCSEPGILALWSDITVWIVEHVGYQFYYLITWGQELFYYLYIPTTYTVPDTQMANKSGGKERRKKEKKIGKEAGQGRYVLPHLIGGCGEHAILWEAPTLLWFGKEDFLLWPLPSQVPFPHFLAPSPEHYSWAPRRPSANFNLLPLQSQDSYLTVWKKVVQSRWSFPTATLVFPIPWKVTPTWFPPSGMRFLTTQRIVGECTFFVKREVRVSVRGHAPLKGQDMWISSQSQEELFSKRNQRS